MNPAYTQRGLLQVAVTTESPVVPVSGAGVRISDPADGAVLQDLITDCSGQPEPVEPPAEDPDDDLPQGDPFSDELEEDPDATRVLNLDDLQFGRNYTRE